MNERDFCFWLHGWSEINGGTPPTAVQWQIINDHLDLVFNKVTPDRQATVSVASTPNTILSVPAGAPSVNSNGGALPFTNSSQPAALPDIKFVSGGPFFFSSYITC